MKYVRIPPTLYGYTQVTITGVSGTFTSGEAITGGTSGASAIIYSKSDTYIRALYNDVSGEFVAGEIITGDTSAATATVSDNDTLNETTVVGLKYKDALIECWALQYHIILGSDEIEARANTIDSLISQIGSSNRIRAGSIS
jgi:hypothetical protein